MPGYKLNGKPLVYFAGYKNHIGLYATPDSHTFFKEEVTIQPLKVGVNNLEMEFQVLIPFLRELEM